MARTGKFDFEDIYAQVGTFGPFQVRVFLLVSAFEVPAAWMLLQHVFTAASPSWVCPEEAGYNASRVLDMAGSNASSILNVTASESRVNSTVCTAQGTVCPGRVYDSQYTSVVTEWDLVCGRDSIRTWIMTSQMAGVLVGACVTGQLADTWGRRRVFYIVYSLLLISGFLSSFANSWQLYATVKFLVGAFFGGTLLVNFVLPLEFVGRRWRTFCGCIGFWACGVMSLSLIAFLIRDWRHLAIATSVGGVPLLLTWWFVPESPRWLVQKGRYEEATHILTRIAEFNKKPVPDFSKFFAFTTDMETFPAEEKRYTYLDLFRSWSMVKNTLILLYAWFVCSSVYYGSSLNVGNLSGNRYINFFLSGLVEIPPLLFVVLVNNRFGRRKTLFFLMLVAGCSMLSVVVIYLAGRAEGVPVLTVALFMLGRAGIAGSWAAAQIFSAELFPTVIRNIGVGSCSMSSRIGGIIAPHMVSLNKVSQPLPFIVFGGLALLGGILTLFLPETLNMPLPDELPPRTCCRRRRDSGGSPSPAVNGHAPCAGTLQPENGPYETVPMSEVNVVQV